jgi:hypothetical protein
MKIENRPIAPPRSRVGLVRQGTSSDTRRLFSASTLIVLFQGHCGSPAIVANAGQRPQYESDREETKSISYEPDEDEKLSPAIRMYLKQINGSQDRNCQPENMKHVHGYAERAVMTFHERYHILSSN